MTAYFPGLVHSFQFKKGGELNQFDGSKLKRHSCLEYCGKDYRNSLFLVLSNQYIVS